MCMRNVWLAQEDQVLRTLLETRKIEKWSCLAKIMADEFGFEGKTGKKCRERYYNHLDPNLNRNQWTPNQEERLLELHRVWGNRWALIAKEFGGRTDNAVKNKFYSKMRKALKIMNLHVNALKLKPKHKPDLKMSFVYKLVEIIEKGHNHQQVKIESSLFALAELIKNRILSFENRDEDISNQLQNQEEKQDLASLLVNIQELNKTYKKRPKAKKRPREEYCESDSEVSIDVFSEPSASEENKELKGFSLKTTEEDHSCQMMEEETASKKIPEMVSIVDLSMAPNNFVDVPLKDFEASVIFFDFEEHTLKRKFQIKKWNNDFFASENQLKDEPSCFKSVFDL